MADWSQLPTELLQLISQKLNSEFYLLRFRSVCSTWRSSIPNYRPNNHLRLKLPIPSFYTDTDTDDDNYSICYLLKHTIFLIKPPPQQQQTLQPWLIRIGPNAKGKTHLWHPLDLSNHSYLDVTNHDFNFPHNVLDFNQLPIVDLGHVFLFYMLKDYYENVVAATCPGELQPLIVTLDDSYVEPWMIRPGDDRWMQIPNVSTCGYGDICNFKGRICVVNDEGQTVMVGSDLSVDLVAAESLSLSWGRLCSVESELLLVDTCPDPDCDCDYGVRINVYRLDEKKKKWVELSNLGDRVLFLGNQCSFSASASDLGFANGNCVINMDVIDVDDMSCAMRDLNLDTNRVSPVSDYPDYFNLLVASGVDREKLHWEKEYDEDDESDEEEDEESEDEGMRHIDEFVRKTC